MPRPFASLSRSFDKPAHRQRASVGRAFLIEREQLRRLMEQSAKEAAEFRRRKGQADSRGPPGMMDCAGYGPRAIPGQPGQTAYTWYEAAQCEARGGISRPADASSPLGALRNENLRGLSNMVFSNGEKNKKFRTMGLRSLSGPKHHPASSDII